nr:hypothetical protein [Cupriavidus sp. KK10]
MQGRAVCGLCGRNFRLRYPTRRERQEAWCVCDRAQGTRGEPCCQSIAGGPIDEAVGGLVTAMMTPAAVELALEIRREIEVRYDEADRSSMPANCWRWVACVSRPLAGRWCCTRTMAAS